MNVERRLIRRGDCLSEPLDLLSGLKGILADAQVHVQGVGVVAEFQQDAPQGEAVFAAGHGHEHAVVGRKHPVGVDGATNLGVHELRQAVFAQGDIVPGHFDDRGVRTFPAAHDTVLPQLSPGNDGSDFNGIGVLKHGVFRHQFVFSDNQVGFRGQIEALQELMNPGWSRHFKFFAWIGQHDFHTGRIIRPEKAGLQCASDSAETDLARLPSTRYPAHVFHNGVRSHNPPFLVFSGRG